MRSARTSRYRRSTGWPRITPRPPQICTASSITSCAASVANILAIAASRVTRWPFTSFAQEDSLGSFEVNNSHGMRRYDLDALGGIHFLGVDDERADAVVGLGEHDIEIGDAAVRNPGLGALEHPGVGFSPRARGHRLHVRAGVGLG